MNPFPGSYFYTNEPVKTIKMAVRSFPDTAYLLLFMNYRECIPIAFMASTILPYISSSSICMG